MSNHLAVATVTEALREFIARNLTDLPLAVNVSAQRPPTEQPAEPTITVFCYQVAPDPQLRNADAPTRASDGTLLKVPRAALDLSYLISFYGDEGQLVPQRMLGCVVRALYVQPTLSHEDIVAAEAQPFLAGSDLGASPQRVRFTPTHLDMNEMYQLWTMMTGTQMALSLSYLATLVFIDGTETPAVGQEVLTRNITVIPSVPAPIAGGP
jgi:Pvc16 N-terminal domain